MGQNSMSPHIASNKHNDEFITLTASSGKRNVTVWRPSVRPSVCLSRLFSSLNRARGAYLA